MRLPLLARDAAGHAHLGPRPSAQPVVEASFRCMGEPTSPGALDGLRVLDFCRLGFGSQATMILGCLGAEVIRIESSTRPDPIRVMPPFVPEPGETGLGFGGATLAQAQKQQSANRGGIFYKYNTGGKRSIAVDARNPDGLDLLRRLVAVSDVVTESFAAGHAGPVGTRLRHVARAAARHHLRVDVRLRPRRAGLALRHHGSDRAGAHRAHASRRAARPRAGGLVVQLPGPRRWVPRRVRGADRARAPARAPARVNTSTCRSSSRPPRSAGRWCSTGR